MSWTKKILILCCVPQMNYKPIVTLAQAGVQLKAAWIQDCAGMT